MATQALGHNVIGFPSGMYRTSAKTPGGALTHRDHSLSTSQILALPDENLNVICLAGELWLTRDGDIEDYILGPGQSFTVRHGDKAAVQALKPGRMRLVSA